MDQPKYNTGLAAEYYVMSMLHRKGANAALTLGNNKSADIIVNKGGQALTIDVKGVQKTDDFTLGKNFVQSKSHYYVFVAFLNKIEDVNSMPDVFVVPSTDINTPFDELVEKTISREYKESFGTNVVYNRLKALESKYKDRWDVFVE
jgi:hypothetical protein